LSFSLLSALRWRLADIHVGNEMPTIHHAIKAAMPGDTIHLEPKVYRDYAGFHRKKGEPGKAITLDGHGATLEGVIRLIRRSGVRFRRDCSRMMISCRA